MTRTMTALAVLLTAFAFSSPAFAADAAAGKVTFEQLCWTCHGMTGKGDGPAGAALTPPPRDFSVGHFLFDANGNGHPGDDEDLMAVIKQGAAAFGGNPTMAPWGHLADDDIANLVAYIRTLKQ